LPYLLSGHLVCQIAKLEARLKEGWSSAFDHTKDLVSPFKGRLSVSDPLLRKSF